MRGETAASRTRAPRFEVWPGTSTRWRPRSDPEAQALLDNVLWALGAFGTFRLHHVALDHDARVILRTCVRPARAQRSRATEPGQVEARLAPAGYGDDQVKLGAGQASQLWLTGPWAALNAAAPISVGIAPLPLDAPPPLSLVLVPARDGIAALPPAWSAGCDVPRHQSLHGRGLPGPSLAPRDSSSCRPSARCQAVWRTVAPTAAGALGARARLRESRRGRGECGRAWACRRVRRRARLAGLLRGSAHSRCSLRRSPRTRSAPSSRAAGVRPPVQRPSRRARPVRTALRRVVCTDFAIKSASANAVRAATPCRSYQ